MQLYILSNLPSFFRIRVPARMYHSFQLNYQLWYLLSCKHVFIRRWACCLMTSFATIHFLHDTVIIPREHFKQSILSSALCFETPIAAIHYIKRTGFTSRTTAQKMKLCIKDFSSKCDQICRKLRIWSHALTEKILNGKLHFLCSEYFKGTPIIWERQL